ncbi:MAG: NADH-quinone oxidoreductase subunit NuoH [bacterium]|nr:MAG: NADH-quinone oxidoreductase subunit NuoH [bacterium]
MENLGPTLTILLTLVRIVLVMTIALLSVPVMVWVERKVSGHIQNRHGPLYVGPIGTLQPFADALKLLLKEDITPANVDKTLYYLAPLMAFVPALMTFSVIPFGPWLKIADVNIGVVLILSVSSLGIYGLVMAGWSSNNKYALLGSLRSSAQMISYEIALGLSVIGVLMHSRSLSLVQIVQRQAETTWFVIPQFLGFVLFTVAAFAETNRLPFDLPEAEQELVAGYHVEYSSMKFAMFFMSEYVAMLSQACVLTVLFLGGWLPFPIIGPLVEGLLPAVVVEWVMPLFWFFLKVGGFMFFYVWVRWTFPRLRYDQLMALGWKVLLPLALFNVFLTGFIRLSL